MMYYAFVTSNAITPMCAAASIAELRLWCRRNLAEWVIRQSTVEGLQIGPRGNMQFLKMPIVDTSERDDSDGAAQRLLTRSAEKASPRRFTGEAITGFGAYSDDENMGDA